MQIFLKKNFQLNFFHINKSKVKIKNMKKILIMINLVLFVMVQLEAHPKTYVNSKVKYVKVKPIPAKVVVIKPACPSPNHIWIDGDWVWDTHSNNFILTPGKWILHNAGYKWIPGHWKHSKYGWNWVNGHWKN